MDETTAASLAKISGAKRRPDKIGELVSLLEKNGADFTGIARLMGENPATVRYWFENKIIERGFTLQAAANHQAIGLRRVYAKVRISADYAPIALRVFEELNDSAFLVAQRPYADGTHMLMASVPNEKVEEYRGFLADLRSIGFLSEILEVITFEWFRNLPMKVRSYDFSSYAWELDLAKQVSDAELKVAPVKLERFDRTDLLVVRRLQANSNLSVRQIAKKMGMNYKKVLRHHKHVLSRKLISSYLVLWMRVGINPLTQKARNPRHEYLVIILDVKDVRGVELENLMREVHRLPFVQAESGGSSYLAEIFIPLNLANEVFTHLYKTTFEYKGRASISVSIVKDAYSYSITPELYDQKNHRWTFDPQATLEKIKSFIPVAKS